MSDLNLSSFLWSVTDLLLGDFKQSDYSKVILPFTVLRRLDCVLERTKPKVLVAKVQGEAAVINRKPFLVGTVFFSVSPLDLKKLMGIQTWSATRR